MEEYEEAQEKADREYRWRRKCEIFNEIENFWLDYLQVLDYPNIDFVTYIVKHSNPPRSVEGAEFLIWTWKNVRRFSQMHQN